MDMSLGKDVENQCFADHKGHVAVIGYFLLPLRHLLFPILIKIIGAPIVMEINTQRQLRRHVSIFDINDL